MERPAEVMRETPTVAGVIEAIAGAQFYVGSSLHGFITATSFEVPAALIVDRGAQHKFEGFARQVGAMDRIWSSWDDVDDAGHQTLLLRPADAAVARLHLESHWDRVKGAIYGISDSARPSAMLRSRLDLAQLATALPKLH
jgi:polysaccharide pyruvyl transferase WcaK-like protein